MTRSVPAWVGAHDDAAIPPRVRLRLFEVAAGCCASCRRKLRPGDKWQVDHVQAIANGGTHAESNMQVLCDWCHKAKSKADVAEKSASYRKRLANAGIRPKPKLHGQQFQKRPPQKNASRPLRRRSEQEATES